MKSCKFVDDQKQPSQQVWPDWLPHDWYICRDINNPEAPSHLYYCNPKWKKFLSKDEVLHYLGVQSKKLFKQTRKRIRKPKKIANDPEVIFRDTMTELAQDMQLSFHIADVSGPMTKEAADGLYTSRFQRPKVRPKPKPKGEASSSSEPPANPSANLIEAQPNEPIQPERPTGLSKGSKRRPKTKRKGEASSSSDAPAHLNPILAEAQPNEPQQPEWPAGLTEGQNLRSETKPNQDASSSSIALASPNSNLAEAQPIGPRQPERPTGLPEGWTIRRSQRKNGKTKGIVDKVYTSPTGEKFRSLKKALEFIQKQNQGPNDKGNAGGSSTAGN